ncbi:hypothetical protein VTN96DRAFT_3272 [Rasamsonia emersonii]
MCRGVPRGPPGSSTVRRVCWTMNCTPFGELGRQTNEQQPHAGGRAAAVLRSCERCCGAPAARKLRTPMAAPHVRAPAARARARSAVRGAVSRGQQEAAMEAEGLEGRIDGCGEMLFGLQSQQRRDGGNEGRRDGRREVKGRERRASVKREKSRVLEGSGCDRA